MKILILRRKHNFTRYFYNTFSIKKCIINIKINVYGKHYQ